MHSDSEGRLGAAERPLRILMLDNEYPPLGGGTGVVNQRILEEWAKHSDVEVDLVTSSRTHDQYEFDQLSPAIRLHKVPVDNQNIHHSTNRELLRYVSRGWRYARRLQRAQAYDMCMAWAGVPAGGMALWLKWEFGLPYVVSLRGPDVPGFEERFNDVYRVLTPFIRRVWRQAAEVNTCSEQLRQLANRTAPGLPIDVIVNGIDMEKFHPPMHVEPKQRPLRILCVGRLIERKGQQYLLPALRKLLDRGLSATLILAGAGDNDEELRRLAANLAVENHVEFLGFVSRGDIPDLYRNADIFALPSFFEGMSNALLEAIASGLPVIVTQTGGTDELVQGNGFVVPWGDVEQLTVALAKLVSDAELRKEMSRASLEIARKFSWTQVSQMHLRACANAARV